MATNSTPAHGDLLLRYHDSKCANPMGQVQNIWYKHYKQPCSIMPNALANSHPVAKNKLQQGKLRTDERRTSGCEALDRVIVGGGGWCVGKYHGFVILPSHPHSPLLSHIIKGALWTKHSAETDHSSCRGPLWASRSCRRPFTAPRQNKDKIRLCNGTTQPVMRSSGSILTSSPSAWLQSWQSIAERYSCGGPRPFLFGG